MPPRARHRDSRVATGAQGSRGYRRFPGARRLARNPGLVCPMRSGGRAAQRCARIQIVRLADSTKTCEEETMKDLKGSKTHQNLKNAFAGESQANRRYLYFAKVADIEGQPEIAGLFRDTAEGETGHAHGHLDYLKLVGDPATDQPIGDSMLNLKSPVAGETY